MDGSDLDREWSILTRLLPAGWREAARANGALIRAREIDSPDTLLRLILLHAASGLSLRQTVARAEIAGLAKVSDVALFKRLRASESWLREMCNGLLEAVRCKLAIPPGMESLRFRAFDATTIEEPGATGTSWRVHYSIALPSLECDFFEVTDVKGGESFKRFPVKKGEVILADRGYCHRSGAAQVLAHGAHIVVRLNLQNLPLTDRRGRSLNILTRLRKLKDYLPGEWDISFAHEGSTHHGRLCAVRKSTAATQQAQDRLIRDAHRKGKEASPDAMEAAGYIFVLTSLPATLASCQDVLELYRARWQIELAFKRMKSLLGAGHVPKYDPESARAWIQAKLLAVLMIERLEQEAALFSPWGFPLSTPKPLA